MTKLRTDITPDLTSLMNSMLDTEIVDAAYAACGPTIADPIRAAWATSSATDAYATYMANLVNAVPDLQVFHRNLLKIEQEAAEDGIFD